MEYQRGDVDQDGQVGISDVTCLIDYLLSGTWPEDPVTPPDDHEYVDLGLPSGTLWATCNVGANAPEDYGDYFAWGETEPKDYYDWSTYIWCNGDYETMTKYCIDSKYGTVDNKTELEPEDDAAYVNWGPSWRIPSNEQLNELIENCTWSWTASNGVNGYQVTGPNGSTLFWPAVGNCIGDWISNEGTDGRYWSRTLCLEYSYGAYYLYFRSGGNSGSSSRSYGRTVRAVRVPQN